MSYKCTKAYFKTSNSAVKATGDQIGNNLANRITKNSFGEKFRDDSKI